MKNTQIISDGRTVWVNSEEGHLIGRFGVFGIDIHRDLCEQSDKGECLYCTHEVTKPADWETFKVKMREHHKVRVTDKHRPSRFQSHHRLVEREKRSY